MVSFFLTITLILVQWPRSNAENRNTPKPARGGVMKSWFEVGKTASVDIKELGEGRVRLLREFGAGKIEGTRKTSNMVHLDNGWLVRLTGVHTLPPRRNGKQPGKLVGTMTVTAWEGVPADAVAA